MIKGENLCLKELNIKNIDLEALSLVPEEFAVKNKVLPIKLLENKLQIAMENSVDLELLARLKLITKMDIITVKYEEDDISDLALKFYELLKFTRAVEKLKHDMKNENRKNNDKVINKDDNNAPAVKILDFIITNAIIKKASDIHLEPDDIHLTIRFRVDGTLVEFLTIPVEIYSALVTRLKVLCSMDISEKRIPQDGKLQHEFLGRTLDLRISSIPVLSGEKFVVRILDKSIEYCSVESIYSDISQVNQIKRLLLRSSGMILITGPTGSGKSTTLYAMLKELNNNKLNITSIEDPVEYTMKGINQISVNNKAGVTFAAGLRSILRQDPDIIMIGEIRDEETAAIAIRAAITGHLVLSTLHTNDALGTVNRLIEMGIERYLLSDALAAVIAQRLVRIICNKCRMSYYPSDFESEILGKDTPALLYRGKGCQDCNNSGYSGRKVLSDILLIDDDIQRCIIRQEEILRTDHKSMTISQQCKTMVVNGVTTIEELIRISNGKVFN